MIRPASVTDCRELDAGTQHNASPGPQQDGLNGSSLGVDRQGCCPTCRRQRHETDDTGGKGR